MENSIEQIKSRGKRKYNTTYAVKKKKWSKNVGKRANTKIQKYEKGKKYS